jgi:hypothetical protein
VSTDIVKKLVCFKSSRSSTTDNCTETFKTTGSLQSEHKQN